MESDIKGIINHETPGIGIDEPEEMDHRMSKNDQDNYRSVVGTLLYIVSHSRPDISNSVRELSKVIHSGTIGNKKSMIRLVNYVKNTKNLGVKFNPIKDGDSCVIKAYVDSDWEGDKTTRKVFMDGLYTYVIVLLDGDHVLRKLWHLFHLQLSILQ